MSGPQNTSADREVNFLGLLAMGSEAYITGQEAAGQRQLVTSESLPTDTSGSDEAFLALGFTFGDPDKGDPMFRPATLPEGWRKVPSDHSMWSYVVDELGRRRVAVFYKAAFYDRSAFMRLESVYSYAHSLAYDGAVPIFDDTWCTLAAFAEQVAAIRAQIVERVELYESRIDDPHVTWAAEELVKSRKDLAKHDAWAAKVLPDPDATDG